jgi:chromosome segregation ATPase
MSQSARVYSVDALRDFQAALARFREDAQSALYAADNEIHRTYDELQQRLLYWQRQVKEWQENLVRAKTALIQRQWGCREGKGPGTTEAELALKQAQFRLKEAEARAETVRRWQRTLPQPVQEYHGPARMLHGTLDTNTKKALVVLANKIAALEAYAAVTVAGEPRPTPAAPLPPDAEVATPTAGDTP